MQRAAEIMVSYITSGTLLPLFSASPASFVSFVEHLFMPHGTLQQDLDFHSDPKSHVSQLWEHTAFSSRISESFPTVVTRTGAIV